MKERKKIEVKKKSKLWLKLSLVGVVIAAIVGGAFYYESQKAKEFADKEKEATVSVFERVVNMSEGMDVEKFVTHYTISHKEDEVLIIKREYIVFYNTQKGFEDGVGQLVNFPPSKEEPNIHKISKYERVIFNPEELSETNETVAKGTDNIKIANEYLDAVDDEGYTLEISIKTKESYKELLKDILQIDNIKQIQ